MSTKFIVKTAISFSICIIMVLQILLSLASVSVSAASPAPIFDRTAELAVVGNKVVWAADGAVEVQLMGVDPYESNYQNITNRNRIVGLMAAAYDEWNSNCLRLNVEINSNKWANAYYKESVDLCVKEAEKRGKYVIIDLHEFGYISEACKNFWLEVAAKYANNPSVLFGILNEPHDMSWDMWRNGGMYTFDNVNEYTYGHQEILEMIRDLGAKNPVVVGGLDWSYDLRGIVGQALMPEDCMPGKVLEWGVPGVSYALIDQGSGGDLSKAGNGVIYDTHIYPWKGWDEWDVEVKLNPELKILDRCMADWRIKVPAELRSNYPVLLGESGWGTGVIRDIIQYVGRNGMTVNEVMNTYFSAGQELYHDKWVPALYDFINESFNGTHMNHTAWCFHTSSAPALITNYTQYAPNDYWGIYVKEDLKNRLGDNLLIGKQIIAASDMAGAENAIDGDLSTAWASGAAGDKYLEVDLGDVYKIGKWGARHSSSTVPGFFGDDPLITADFSLQASNDGITWVDVDAVYDNVAPVTQRIVKAFEAQYIRLNITKPTAAGAVGDSALIYDFYVSGVAKYAPDTAYVSISGPATVVSGVGATATYTISAAHMPAVGGIELEFEVDGNFLSSKEFTALGGFTIVGVGNYGTPLQWTNNGNIWKGKVTLLNLSLAAISGDVDIFEMVFNVAEGELGATDVKLNYVLMSVTGGTVAAEIENGVATTVLEQWYSRYDLNKDGIIDLNDLTYALQFLGATNADPEWAQTYVCDLEPDGIITIDDLILILANYTIPYYS